MTRMRRGVVGAAVSILLAASASAGATQRRVYSFGANNAGQLGVATNTGTFNANPTPFRVRLAGATGAPRQINAGGLTSFVVTRSDQLYAFGRNDVGQLGLASVRGVNATPSIVTLPGASGSIRQVFSGGSHTLALTSSGQVYAFGFNAFGQLGVTTNSGTSTPNPTPMPVALPGATGHAVQVAAGFFHSLVLTSTGQVFAFGHNRYGQLGSTTNSGTGSANPTPILVSLPGAVGTVTRIAVGEYTSFAVTSSGQLFAWGWNYAGQLGNTTNDLSNNPNPTPALVTLPGATGSAVQVSSGGEFTLVLTSTGQLYAFGSNHEGELGIATNSGTMTPNASPALVALPGATGRIVAISAGETYSMAVTSTGQLYAFGDNTFGELGISANAGTSTPNPTPARVRLPGGRIALMVSAGEDGHTLVLGVAPPVISKLKIAPQRFRVRDGAVVTYTDSAATTTTLTVLRKAHGKLHRVGALTHHDHAGHNNVSFSGRVSGHALAPGSYVLVVAAAGGKPNRVTFTILA